MTGNLYTLSLQDVAAWPRSNVIVDRQWLPPLAIAWMSCTTLLVAGRLHLRPLRTAEDWLLLYAWFFAVGFTVVACIAVWDFDVGRHLWQLRPERYDGAAFMGWLAQVFFTNSTGAIKTSILLFYMRMARNYNRIWQYAVYVFLLITVGSWISFFIAYCFICQPLDAYWSVHLVESDRVYSCLDGPSLTISSGAITIASDLWTAGFPCLMFYYNDLGITPRQRLGLNLIFCTGFLVTGAAIARTYYLWRLGHEMDNTWLGYNLFVASQIETQLSIMCTCAPFIRAFFRRYSPRREEASLNQYTSASYQEPLNFSRPLRLPSFDDKDIELTTQTINTPLESLGQDKR